jgi:dihydrofolate reductase
MQICVIYAKRNGDGAFGTEDGLPWPRSKEDMRRFRQATRGHAVIMGRKTWESLGRQPLEGRFNIVVSRAEHARDIIGNKDAQMRPSLSSAIELARDSGSPQCWIIGGVALIQEAIINAQSLGITRVHRSIFNHVILDDADPAIKTNEEETKLVTQWIKDDNTWLLQSGFSCIQVEWSGVDVHVYPAFQTWTR